MHHGVGGNFYNPSLDAVGDRLLAEGVAVLRVNNRGHDIAYNPVRTGTGNYAQTLARGATGTCWALPTRSSTTAV